MYENENDRLKNTIVNVDMGVAYSVYTTVNTTFIYNTHLILSVSFIQIRELKNSGIIVAVGLLA